MARNTCERKKEQPAPKTRTLQVTGEGCSACHQGIKSRRGQQIIEYALVIGAISAALMAMYIYTKRGLQSNIKDLMDYEVGPQRESMPTINVNEHENSTAVSHDLSQATTRGTKMNGDTLYESNSFTSSQGNSVYVYDDMK